MERYPHPLLHLFLFFFLLLLVHGQLSQNQTQIMRNLSNTLPAISSPSDQWNSGGPNPCRWNWVFCSPPPNQTVTKISLSGRGLGSTNSSAAADFFRLLCRLDTLRRLDLSTNLFSAIPSSFFSNCAGLAGLKYLNLSSNRLTGPLPDFSTFLGLEILDLAVNYMNQTVGTQLDSLPRLKTLNLSTNFLVGGVPAHAGDSKAGALQELVLSGNHFNGSIPAEMFDYENLTVLDLSRNNLSGSLPDEFKKLPNLEILLLSANGLGGELPASLSSAATLSRFAAYQNNFMGSIPSGITSHVRTLDLSYNQLDGQIPADLLAARILESVDLTNNHLQGPIPQNLSQSLYRLRLGGNNLTGTIPASIGQLSSLAYLELDDNELNSDIPVELGNCKNLTLLNLAHNNLHGNLPTQLGDLRNLVVLTLQNNHLAGTIPSEFSNLSSLITLNLSQNSLTGQIPSGITSLQKLARLDLQGNELDGPIPETVTSLASLLELQLGNNKLNGTVPRMPTSLTIALNLSKNDFSGSIPQYLSDLTQLEILDLSYNDFSGQVPSSLTKLESLTQLVLSYNNLSGVLPTFGRYVTVTTTGNIYLTTSLNSTEITHTTKRKRSTPLLIAVVVVVTIVVVGLIAATLLFSLSKRFYRVEDEGLQSVENAAPQIINGCFITTNSIHISSIDFNKAIEAVSNPANVFLKTRFCTYYKAVMPNGAAYSVKKLNWVDKIGSHQRFGQELETLGWLSSSNIMVPLAYVLTQDSAYLFYKHVYKGIVFDFLHGADAGSDVLGWQNRYSIALGVAQGLTFLHGCTQPVLLLDLSTRTIHLKSPNEPQIGDIELYKVIDPSRSTGSFSTVAGTVGYIPPEYAYTMRLTMAGNVYSFGVVLLELLTGKPPVSEGIELAKWALGCSSRLNEREKILDPRISTASLAVRSQMLAVLKIALSCVALSPDARPKMRNVLRMLFTAV